MTAEPTRIFEGNVCLVGDLAGNIDAETVRGHGLFAWDTRFLSRWVLKVDGRPPEPLLAKRIKYCEVDYWLTAVTAAAADPVLTVIRKQTVSDEFTEELTIRNESASPVSARVAIEASADFIDVLELDHVAPKKGDTSRFGEDHRLVLRYERGRFSRETRITSTVSPNLGDANLTFDLTIPARGEWSTRLNAEFLLDPYWTAPIVTYAYGFPEPAGKDLDLWLQRSPALRSSWPVLSRIYEQSLADLTALRFNAKVERWAALPAAGAPRNMCVRGRDCLTAGFQALPFVAGVAETSLHALSNWQGSRVDSFRDEEPGKILDELRFGELVAFEEQPQSPYFGAADTTPLFLIVLDEYVQWTGDRELARSMERSARAALTWIDEFGDLNGDGYVDYRARDAVTGLANQCWKRSPKSILFADGTDSLLPRAPCEIQGYVYDAKVRTARIARDVWDDQRLAKRLEDSASDLKARFNRDYWNEARSCFGLAIDGRGRLVDSICSNVGHLLWSGIAEPDKAALCVERLMSDDLFSGWGVRTMAKGEGGYNPLGSHTGAVWPHDNSIIAYGLAKYGFKREAGLIAAGTFEAASHFDGRLPEALAGYSRDQTTVPVQLPGTSLPSAWAAGASLLMLRALLGLEPGGDRLLVDPHLPEGLEIELSGIQGSWGRADARSAAQPRMRARETAARQRTARL